MLKETITRITLLILISTILFSCTKQEDFEVTGFTPISNHSNSDTVNYTVDLENAIKEGVIIPTKDGNQDYFKFNFKIKNNTNKAKRYHYKIYYQNISYAHELFTEKIEKEKKYRIKNPKANNNFYGSWNMDSTGFHTTEIIAPSDDFIQVTDSFSILGNPRNENKYFGSEFNAYPPTEKEIQNVITKIKGSVEWIKNIQDKAKEKNIPVDKQLFNDAVWYVNHEKEKGDFNNRWKRNPRTGLYNFLLVVVEDDKLESIPVHYQDVTKKDSLTNSYSNPYQFYLSESTPENVFTELAQQKLNVKVKYELDRGVYKGVSAKNEDSLTYFAQFEQYFHSVDKKHGFDNIPLKEDIFANPYTLEDFKKNANKFSENELIRDYIKITENPGTTVGYDQDENGLFLINNGQKNKDEYKKENVGVNTRHGFTYGKYIAKIKFPKIINSSYVWNGLTCAFWLKYQNGGWNTRSNCISGYNPKLYSDSAKVKSSTYSEIDIEIVKTSKYWPKSSYGGKVDFPQESALNENIIMSCTNWDLACHDLDSFHVGVRDIFFEDEKFTLHRWDNDYRAVTSKYEIPQDSVLGREFYYVIEWQPDYIEWKVGPTKDNLMTIGYMDNKSTMIPDNQMQMVFTQEYHLSEWWPLTPFKQENIPYPLNDVTGYIYEVEIE